jgi:uncharacterized membrane protein
MLAVELILRWLHIMAAATAIGGMVFIFLALLPALAEFDETTRGKVHAALRSRWSKVVMASIAVLLITGLVNFFLANSRYTFKGTPYHMLFGIKFLLALVVFFISSLLTGRSGLAEKVRQNARIWVGVNLILVMILVGLSAGLKVTREKAPPRAPGETKVTSKLRDTA